MFTSRIKMPANVKEYFGFQIHDDYIENRGRQIYFLRVHPKNMSILNMEEKAAEVKQLQSFLDAAATRFGIFVTDKTENLSEISDFYKQQIELRPEYAFVIEPILDRINSIERSSASIQRAFYFFIKVRDRREYESFERQLNGRMNVTLAQKEELILLMRNFILREYTPFSLYVFEDAVKKHYTESARRARRNRHMEDPVHEQKENSRAAIDRIAQSPEGESEVEQRVPTAGEKDHDDGGNLWPHA